MPTPRASAGSARPRCGGLPLLPLFIYHAAHGSLSIWFNDIVLVAFGETKLEFFGKGWYGLLPLAAFYQVVTSFDPVKIVNGLYWLVLPLLPAANGIVALSRLRRNPDVARARVPILAAFFALVALYLEGPLVPGTTPWVSS